VRTKREDGVRVYDILYTTELYDASAMPVHATVSLTPNVTGGPPLGGS
jgi:hypothetical protein